MSKHGHGNLLIDVINRYWLVRGTYPRSPGHERFEGVGKKDKRLQPAGLEAGSTRKAE